MIRYDAKINADIRKSVNSFNRKVQRLSKKYPNMILPEKVKVRDLKSDFQNKTRRELRSELKRLSNFSGRRENIKFENNKPIITKWELKKLSRETRSFKKAIDKEIEYYKVTKPKIFGVEQATTYVSMGDSEYQNLIRKRKKLDSDIKNMDKEHLKNYKNFTTSLSNREKNKLTFKENYLQMLEDNAFFYQIDKNMADSIYNYFLEMDEAEFYDMFKSDKGIQSILSYYKMLSDISDNIDFKHLTADVEGVMIDLFESIKDEEKINKLRSLAKV